MIARGMLSTALLLLLAAPSLAAGMRGSCEVRFRVSSTFNDFSGTGSCRPFTAPLQRNPDGNLGLPLVEVAIPVAGMETGIGARDKDMRKMLQADRYPEIHGSVRGVDVDTLRKRMREDPEGKARFGVTLAIRGVERQIPVVAGALKEEGSRASFEIEFPVSLKGFGIDAPTVFGFVRVGDEVSVKASFTVELPEEP